MKKGLDYSGVSWTHSAVQEALNSQTSCLCLLSSWDYRLMLWRTVNSLFYIDGSMKAIFFLMFLTVTIAPKIWAFKSLLNADIYCWGVFELLRQSFGMFMLTAAPELSMWAEPAEANLVCNNCVVYRLVKTTNKTEHFFCPI